MEEWVGALWHRAVNRAASREHAAARVALEEVRPLLGVLFRAAGGDAATRLAPAGEVATALGRGARGWLQRVAGAGQRAALAQWSPGVLALPPTLAVFAERALNRDLYLWLAAQAACWQPQHGWLADNRAATVLALQRFPGLSERHARLLDAHLAQRPAADSSPAEAAVQAALRGQPVCAPALRAEQVAPVWLWLDGQPGADDTTAPRATPDPARRRDERAAAVPQDELRHRARRARDETGRAPLLMPFRAEALFGWADHLRADRARDDEPDEQALAAANDLNTLAIAPDGDACAARVKFDLDLPSAAADDQVLDDGLLLPEWDHRRGLLRQDHCRVQTLVARPGTPFTPGPALRATAQRVRRRLEVINAAPAWRRGQAQGERIDVDAWVRHSAAAGAHNAEPPVYAERQTSDRHLATLLLADLSLSTDAWVGGAAAPARWRPGAAPVVSTASAGQGERRVIDIVRDALYVFGEALSATGDAFEMLGFSSVRRQHVRIQHLKGFAEPWNQAVRDRVGAVKPGFYTRMGAAVRFATQRLQQRPERQRLLLLLTDGKPNDLDVYEGRYGLEDTRHALHAARAAGLTPFCVTIDARAEDYLPHLFGRGGWTLVRRPAELPARLAQVRALLGR